jgi:hypothetical protein
MKKQTQFKPNITQNKANPLAISAPATLMIDGCLN